MMVMCPHCFEIFPELWVVPCHKCGTKTFATDLSIVNIVKRLIELGFRIAYSCCYTDDNEDGIGKTTQIKIEFSEKYPSALFPELPPEWSTYESYDIDTQRKYTGLQCICKHPPSECDDDVVNFDKMVTITNFETWLGMKDPDAYKALLLLYGCG